MRPAMATSASASTTMALPTSSSCSASKKPGGVYMFFHGLNERIPVAAFYQAIDHIHDLAVELGGR
jgi:hypothetical protein